MSRRTYILLSVCGAAAALAWVLHRTTPPGTPTLTRNVAQAEVCDNKIAHKRIQELEEENARLRSQLAKNDHTQPTPVDAQTEAPTPKVEALPRNETPIAPSIAAAPLEKDLRAPINSEEQDREFLKNLEIAHPTATILAAHKLPSEKILDVKGSYQGRIFFLKGGAGTMDLLIDLPGTVHATITNSEGKVISNSRNNSSTVDLRKADGSEALLLNISPYEALQFFIKDDTGNIVGNYYERKEPGSELKRKAEFILTRN